MVFVNIILVLLCIVALVGGYTAIKLLRLTRNIDKKVKLKFTISDSDSNVDVILAKFNSPINLNKQIMLTNTLKVLSKEEPKQLSEDSKQENYVEPYALI